MRRIYISTILILAGAAASNAQNLNPTVEVNRAYEGKLIEVQKPLPEMAMPDSVGVFKLNFDYSVFDNPFRGAGDFNPYLIELKPQTRDEKPACLYLKAGGGFGARPMLDIVYSPRLKKSFKLNLFANTRAYAGRYCAVGLAENANNPEMPWLRPVSNKYFTTTPEEAFYKGRDIAAEAGVDGRWDHSAGFLSFKAAYEGFFAGDKILNDSRQNGSNIELRAASRDNRPGGFFYDASVAARYYSASAHGAIPEATRPAAEEGAPAETFTPSDPLRGIEARLDARLGPILRDASLVAVDIFGDVNSYAGLVDCQNGVVGFTPKYIFTKDGWKVEAGVKLAFPIISRKLCYGFIPTNTAKGQYVYPDISVDYEAVKGLLNVKMLATGGVDANSHFSMRRSNNFIDTYMRHSSMLGGGPLMQNSIESFNLAAGIQGNAFGGKFKYGAMVGYRSVKNGLVNGALITTPASGESPAQMCPTVLFNDYGQFRAATAMTLGAGPISASLGASYLHTNLYKKGRTGFAPSPFNANARVQYSLKDRLFTAIGVEYALGRKGLVGDPAGTEVIDTKIPGYTDLGIELKYLFTRKIGLWLEARNLIGMGIQRIPMYVERGPSFTAGICVNL